MFIPDSRVNKVSLFPKILSGETNFLDIFRFKGFNILCTDFDPIFGELFKGGY